MVNRIDSRARGNAPQMLEKYRKMAHDAHLNGDRVTEEYNLQFADHYFRVIADQRMRQEEQRLRRDDRGQDNGDAYREEVEETVGYGPDADYAAYDNPGYVKPREDRPREDRPREDRPREDRPRREERDQRDAPDQRETREPRPPREPRQQVVAKTDDADDNFPAQVAASADEAISFEPAENPFLRENRGTRGLKPRRDERRPRREDHESDDVAPALDPSLLPPSISAGREQAPEVVPAEPAAEEKPRRRAPRRKPSADDAGETLESVG